MTCPPLSKGRQSWREAKSQDKSSKAQALEADKEVILTAMTAGTPQEEFVTTVFYLYYPVLRTKMVIVTGNNAFDITNTLLI
jgi:hypothetical protein